MLLSIDGLSLPLRRTNPQIKETGHSMQEWPVLYGPDWREVGLEGELDGCLKCATAADAVHAALSAAEGARDLAEVSCRDAAAVGVGELWCVAELEGFDAGLQRGFAVDVEALEEGEVVLNVARAAELISAGVAESHVLRCAVWIGAAGASCGLCEGGWVKPVSAGPDAMGDLVGSGQVRCLRGSRRVESCAVCLNGER